MVFYSLWEAFFFFFYWFLYKVVKIEKHCVVAQLVERPRNGPLRMFNSSDMGSFPGYGIRW